MSNDKEVTALNVIFLDPLQINVLDVMEEDMLLENFHIEEQLLVFVIYIRLMMKMREKKKISDRKRGMKYRNVLRGMMKKGWMRG